MVITRVDIPVPRLENEIRIVVVADPQPTWPHVTAERLEAVVTEANRQRGDIVVLLGDYVSTNRLSTEFVRPADTMAVLGRLAAAMGLYAVLGNHDWWFDGQEIRRLLIAQGIAVLEDEAVLATHEALALWVAGLADPITQPFDLAATLAQADNSVPIVLLSHTPDVFPEVPAVVDLTLAGHTHGGQVYVPGIGRPVVPSRFGDRYAYGHIVEGGRHLFVSSGIGTAIIPVRFLTPPEIVVITLESDSS